ncbi:hypothetical protein AX774_g4495 [Zancudomyces culisetae]|uniref:Uncharacterized protein n=1 Tax=Zancudomyces culisetae TaxID=1213189 RepID=A0A1R1PM82_ZANCU|nr:hypothetical protein AX774_g4495 [Zancudomyces culisetae]|eukprot:OMH82043.1 hypothetical protein AX774_g4495 [Zancudomyces culisetae]
MDTCRKHFAIKELWWNDKDNSEFEVENGVTAQDFKKEYILGTATGLLVLRDPRMSYKITNWVEAYSGGVGYISEVGSHLLTSGWSIM